VTVNSAVTNGADAVSGGGGVNPCCWSSKNQRGGDMDFITPRSAADGSARSPLSFASGTDGEHQQQVNVQHRVALAQLSCPRRCANPGWWVNKASNLDSCWLYNFGSDECNNTLFKAAEFNQWPCSIRTSDAIKRSRVWQTLPYVGNRNSPSALARSRSSGGQPADLLSMW